MQEERVSTSAHFVTLTYNSTHIPISVNGFMTLRKKDLQLYWKRLRKLHPDGVKIKYYACGEYGEKRSRPHYHAIVFNADERLISDAWGLGHVHIDKVTSDSVAYTMKYIDKGTFRPHHLRDDRVPEFSVMSNGLGISYLSDQVRRYHLSDPTIMHVRERTGRRIAMPRYYRKKLYDDEHLQTQLIHVQQVMQKKSDADYQHYKQMYGDREDFTYADYCKSKIEGSYNQFYSRVKARKRSF